MLSNITRKVYVLYHKKSDWTSFTAWVMSMARLYVMSKRRKLSVFSMLVHKMFIPLNAKLWMNQIYHNNYPWYTYIRKISSRHSFAHLLCEEAHLAQEFSRIWGKLTRNRAPSIASQYPWHRWYSTNCTRWATDTEITHDTLHSKFNESVSQSLKICHTKTLTIHVCLHSFFRKLLLEFWWVI